MSNHPCSAAPFNECHINNDEVDFHGAKIVSANGQETPITENMIQDTCNQLIEAWDIQHDKSF